MGLNVLPHFSYSPDLAPSDFPLLSLLMAVLRGRRFAEDDDSKHNMPEDVRHFSKELYVTDTQRLM